MSTLLLLDSSRIGLKLQILEGSTNKNKKNVQFNGVHSSLVGIITPRELEHVLMTDILFSVGKKNRSIK